MMTLMRMIKVCPPETLTGARAVMCMQGAGTHPGSTSAWADGDSALRVSLCPIQSSVTQCVTCHCFQSHVNLVASGALGKLALEEVSMVKMLISSSPVRNELGRARVFRLQHNSEAVPAPPPAGPFLPDAVTSPPSVPYL